MDSNGIEKKNNQLSVIKNDGTINLLALNETEKKQYLDKVSNLDGKNINALMEFGGNIGKRISDNASKFFEHCKVVNTGEVSELITDMMSQLEMVNPDDIASLPNKFAVKYLYKLPIVGKYIQKTNKIIKKCDTVSNTVNTIATKISDGKLKLGGDNNSLQTMIDNDRKTVSDLGDYIIGGKLKLQELDDELKEMIDHSDLHTPMEIQDKEKYINLLDKKVTDQILSHFTLKDSIIEKRAIQMGNVELMNNAETMTMTTIPLWKNSLANAIALNNQRKVLNDQRVLREHTNTMIETTSNTLRTQMKLINEENESTAIAVESLKKRSNNLMGMLIDTKKSAEQGRINRRTAEETVLKLTQTIQSMPVGVSLDELTSWANINIEGDTNQ
jgi:uncharacterized protein YaaN involved in tellurite resistance